MDSFKNFKQTPEFTKLKTNLSGMDPDEVFSSVPYEKGYLLLVAIERAVGRGVFDRFIHSYISDFRFTSATTEQFLDYLERKLPGLNARMDVRAWVYQPDLPSGTPEFSSRLIDDVKNVRAEWDKGNRELKPAMAKWNVDQAVLFLTDLPSKLPETDCRAIGQLFDVAATRNDEILLPWYCLAASSNYSKEFPRIHDFLGTVGRGKYLKPLYRALHGNPDTRILARDWFTEFSGRYHSVARNAVQRILAS
jgi:hypothetical protein